ncbi:integral membrane protein [Hypoxylon sp. FL1857]|nr:integral membrane protein [Hypoxylon sp. FL1857]
MYPNTGLICGFLFIYLALIGYFRSICWRDPTSKFFQAQRAHAPAYSTHRIQQAEQYAASVGATEQTQGTRKNPPPELCIGIPSVQRDGISYLKLTLGSLQHGLSHGERSRLSFVVLLAHTNQTKHPDYGRPWLTGMADRLPSYNDDPERLALAEIMELNQTHGTKSKFDYSIVMEECERTRAPYIMIVEDDVVFLDGWRHRTMQALDEATARSWGAGYTDFLYLRLFYYEGLLGWNAESWPAYLSSSLAVTACVVGFLVMARRCVPAARLHLTRSAFILITFIFTPLLIILFFVAGSNCVLPQPSGVQLMPKNACCGQGFVFSRTTVNSELLPLFRNNRWSEVPTDSFIERYADMTGGLRWALTPVVIQHVGGQSSHGVPRGAYGNMTGGKIWNFGFEENDAETLAAEHLQMNARTW